MELGPCSFPGRKETGRRMSGSGCWRMIGRASPSPIGKHSQLGLSEEVLWGWLFLQWGKTNVTICSCPLNIRHWTEQTTKMSCFGNDPCWCYGRVIFFFSLSKQNRQVSIEVTFSSFYNPISLFFFPFSYSLLSAQSTKKAYPLESARGSPGERVSRHQLWGGSGHPRPAPRPHPFTQDPAMPPLTPPNTLAQLEEACRRLAEVSKPPKQR